MKLLIVDESAFDRFVMEKVFSGFYELFFAVNNPDSVIQCGRHQPDVVYYELRAPDLNALRSICDTVSGLSPSPPLIVAISENSVELERYARIRQVFYFLIRPFNLAELWDALESAFAFVKPAVDSLVKGSGPHSDMISPKNRHSNTPAERKPNEPK